MQNLSLVEPQSVGSIATNSSTLASGEGLALSAPSAAAIATLPPAIDPSSDRSLPPILIADDDDDDRFFIKRVIKKTGIENPVLAFDDGSEVVNYLGSVAAAGAAMKHREPRLLFLDLRMRGLGGFGFLEWVRKQQPALPLTVVVLSNSAEPEDMKRAMELGAHRYLIKYPSLQTFTTIVRSVYPFHLAT